MKKKNIIIFLSIFFLGFIIGDLESKKIIAYFESLKNNKLPKEDLSIDQRIIKANSFDLSVEDFLSLKFTSNDLPAYILRTAGCQINKKQELTINNKYRCFNNSLNIKSFLLESKSKK